MKTPSAALVAEMLALVAPAEAAFRGRWRMSTLQRVDPELYVLLVEQQSLYDQAMFGGTAEEMREQAEAMVRGWRAAVQALEDPLRPDDAFLTGYDPATGVVVLIAEHQQAVARYQVRDGQKIITVTPDEVAKVFAGLTLIREAKSLFPDAELVGFVGEPGEGEAVLRHEAMKVAQG